MADMFGGGYGINDTSLLSGENAATARMIQDAFTRSMLARDRQAARYGLPALASFNQDNALRQAQTTAGVLNQNQQLQKAIDQANRGPHGFLENLNAYLPALSGLMRLSPALFGTDNQWTRQGLLGTVKSWFTDPSTGVKYGLDSSGNVIQMAGKDGTPINMGQPTWPNAGSGVDAGFDFGSPMSSWWGSGTPTNMWPTGGWDWGTWPSGFGEAAVDWGGGWPTGFGESIVDWFGGW